MSYTQRSHSWLAEQGYMVGTVERFISPKSFVDAGYKRDLFGCIDAIAVRTGEVLAVQTCGSDWAPHWKKLLHGSGTAGLTAWLKTACPFLLLGWRELKEGWCPRVHYFTLTDLLLDPGSTRHRSYEDWVEGRQ